LDDVVLPVGEPDGAVGADLGEDGGQPFVAAGDEVEGVVGGVTGAVALHVEERDGFHRGLADHGLALEAGGEVVGVNERAAGGGGVAAHDVDLAEVRREGVGLVLGVDALGGHGARAFGDDGGGEAAEENGGVVGGAAKLVAKLVGAVAPRVVGELVEEFEGGAVGFEAVGALRELFLDAADGAFEAGVTDGAVEPVVVAVMEIVGLGVGVVDAPAGHDLGADVGFVVAVGVFQKEETRRLGDDDAAVGEDETGGDVEAVGEDRELVGATVAVGVLANFDGVGAEAVGLDVVRVVAGFGDPEAAAFVPGEEDGLGDVGLGGEEFEAEIGGDLGAFGAAFDAEGKLKRDGLGAFFVVGDGGAGFALFGFALGEEFFPRGDAVEADGGEEFGFRGEGVVSGGGVAEGGGGEALGGGDGGERFRVGGGRGVEDDEVELGGEVRRGGGGIGDVVEPDRVAAEVTHQGVGGHARGAVGGAEIKHADRAGGAGECEQEEGGESEEGHGEGWAKQRRRSKRAVCR
jgi:hypothetical protein